MAGNYSQPARYASFNSSSSALSIGDGWRDTGYSHELLGYCLLPWGGVVEIGCELTSAMTASDSFVGVTDKTGIFAEASGSR